MKPENEKLTINSLVPIDDETLARAAHSILLLPLTWRSDEGRTVYSESTESVAKLFSQNGVASETLTPVTAETNLKQERSMDWVGPVLLVSAQMASQNPLAVNFALNLLANYVTDLFKGIKADPNVKLKIVQTEQRGKAAREIHYEGPASGLSELAKVVSQFKSKD